MGENIFPKHIPQVGQLIRITDVSVGIILETKVLARTKADTVFFIKVATVIMDSRNIYSSKEHDTKWVVILSGEEDTVAKPVEIEVI